MCSLYCADGTFINEPSKYLSASLTSLATMTQMSLPHINILTKCDKIEDKEFLERMTQMNFEDCFEKSESYFNKKYLDLNMKLFDIIEGFSLVQFTTANIMEEDSIYDLIL